MGNENIFDEIFSIIEIDKLNSKEEFDEFISLLINHPNPTREAVANKLDELYDDKYLDENSLEIILKAVVDINPNVARCVCSLIEKNPLLKEKIEFKIISKIKELLLEIPSFDILQNNKSHAKNKKIFSLYWLLEALSISISDRYNSSVLEILKTTIKFSDYTIREKTAKILSKIHDIPAELSDSLKNESNFYVNFYIKNS